MSRQNQPADRKSQRISFGVKILLRRQFVWWIDSQRIAASFVLGLLLLRNDGFLQLGFVQLSVLVHSRRMSSSVLLDDDGHFAQLLIHLRRRRLFECSFSFFATKSFGDSPNATDSLFAIRVFHQSPRQQWQQCRCFLTGYNSRYYRQQCQQCQ